MNDNIEGGRQYTAMDGNIGVRRLNRANMSGNIGGGRSWRTLQDQIEDVLKKAGVEDTIDECMKHERFDGVVQNDDR